MNPRPYDLGVLFKASSFFFLFFFAFGSFFFLILFLFFFLFVCACVSDCVQLVCDKRWLTWPFRPVSCHHVVDCSLWQCRVRLAVRMVGHFQVHWQCAGAIAAIHGDRWQSTSFFFFFFSFHNVWVGSRDINWTLLSSHVQSQPNFKWKCFFFFFPHWFKLCVLSKFIPVTNGRGWLHPAV